MNTVQRAAVRRRDINPRVYLNRVIGLVVFSLVIEEAISFLFMSRADAVLNLTLSSLVGGIAILIGWFVVIKPLKIIIDQFASEIAERETAKIRDRFQLVFENLQEGIVLWNSNTQSVEMNPAASRLLSLDLSDDIAPDEQSSVSFEALFRNLPVIEKEGKSRERFESYLKHVQLNGRSLDRSLEIRDARGSSKWLRCRFHPVFSEDSTVPGSILVVLNDISTEVESKTRLEVALKAGGLGVWDWDVVQNRLIWDQSMFQIFDVDPSEFEGTVDAFIRRVIDSDRQRLEDLFRTCIKERTDFSAEFQIERRDGSKRTIRAESKGSYSEDGQPLRFVGVNWDITEYREKDLRLIQASRLSSVGEMSAGIAHEINNPLAVIFGRATVLKSLVSREMKESQHLEKALSGIKTIERTAMRIATIIRGLKSFSRDGNSDPFELIEVDSLLADALDFCRNRFANSGIDLRVNGSAPGLKLECRPVQITQVILNLLNNAHDAVAASSQTDRWVTVDVEAGIDHILISVTDSGPGIPIAVREKLMQPFFTTKPVGQGTGLGLSISHGLCVSHGGQLYLDSACERTRFVVSLPVRQQNENRVRAS